MSQQNVPKINQVRVPPGLFGTPIEVQIKLNGNLTTALLDTGSTVSTVSENYYREHMSTPLITIEKMLDIECADGKKLPYIRYTEVDIQIPAPYMYPVNNS